MFVFFFPTPDVLGICIKQMINISSKWLNNCIVGKENIHGIVSEFLRLVVINTSWLEYRNYEDDSHSF